MNPYLNPKEEEVMKILWKIKKGFVKEIIAEMPKPHPPYTSVSTLVRRLEERNIVGHDAFGKTHRYYAILTEQDYTKQTFFKFFKDYFQGSHEKMVSFFVKEQNTDIKELENILEEIKKKEKE